MEIKSACRFLLHNKTFIDRYKKRYDLSNPLSPAGNNFLYPIPLRSVKIMSMLFIFVRVLFRHITYSWG